MNAIHIQFKNSNSLPLVIYCESKDTMNVFNFLENNPGVMAYKIISGDIGEFNEDSLKYYFGGFFYPAGKLVEKFDWNQRKSETVKTLNEIYASRFVF